MNTGSVLSSKPPQALIVAAFAAIYIIWGSTYMAIRVAVETMPPFLMAGFRFVVAGAALYAWLRWKGVSGPTSDHWRSAAITGTLMLLGGNGLVVWAEQTVPSSFAALLIALVPVWFALLDWLRPGGNRPKAQTVAGILVGFSGVMMLVLGRNGEGADKAIQIGGVLALVAAGISWAGGSLYARSRSKSESPWMNAALQMICGGLALLLLSLGCGEWVSASWGHFSDRSMIALLYLIVFGSWIGFGAYVWLLKVSNPARVATYAYVNPVAAVLLGWALLNEAVTTRTVWAALIIIFGVVITTWPGFPKRMPR